MKLIPLFRGTAARKLRMGGYALLLTIAVLALAVFSNLLIDAADDSIYLKIDLSPDRISSVSEQTKKVLSGLTDDVHISLVFSAGTNSDLRTLLTETLDRYSALSDHIKTDIIDPAREPHRIAPLNKSGKTITEGSAFITNADASRVYQIGNDEFTYRRSLEGTVYSLYSGEIRFTGAIMNVTRSHVPSVCFLSGHGEKGFDDCQVLKLQLEASGYNVFSSGAGTQETAECEVIFVFSPQTDLTETEVNALKKQLDAGGHLLVAYDASTPQEKLNNFSVLMDLYGLGFEKGYVVENPENTGSYVDRPDFIKPDTNTGHEIVRLITERLILPQACAVAVPGLRTGIKTESLLSTSDQAYRKTGSTDDLYTFVRGDVSGKQVLALAASGPDNMRVILLSSVQMFLDNAEVTGANLLNASDNLEFLVSCASWLSGTDAEIASADLKVMPTNMMTFDSEAQQNRVSLLIMIFLPALTLAVCAAVILRRRRL